MVEQLEDKSREVLSRYPVRKAALFGSAARGDMVEQSDVDMLVEFMPNARGLDFFGLRIDLEEALGCPVDLLTWKSLAKAKTTFKQNVESEARVIYEQ